MTLIILLAVTVCSLLIGIFLGRSGSQAETAEQVEVAYARGREESEVEKANLALELGEHLAKMRSCIQQTAEVYQQTVNAVQERLSLSPEVLEKISQERLISERIIDGTNLSLPLTSSPQLSKEEETVKISADAPVGIAAEVSKVVSEPSSMPNSLAETAADGATSQDADEVSITRPPHITIQ